MNVLDDPDVARAIAALAEAIDTAAKGNLANLLIVADAEGLISTGHIGCRCPSCAQEMLKGAASVFTQQVKYTEIGRRSSRAGAH